MKNFLLTSIICGIPFITMAQPSIHFLRTTAEVGKIPADAYPPVPYPFINTGDAPLAILLIQKGPGVKAAFPRTFINPGDTGIIYLHAGSDGLGPFHSEATVFSTAPVNPIKLSLSGERLTVNSCFPNPKNLLVREVHVLDSITQKPVPGADIVMVRNGEQTINGNSGKKGVTTMELPIGMYNCTVKAPGYPELKQDFFIPKSKPVIWFLVGAKAAKEEIPLPPPIQVVQEIHPPDSMSLTDRYADNNIILLLDVSLSMKQEGKLDLMKSACRLLIESLRPVDHVSLITYSQQARVIEEAVPGNNKTLLLRKIDQLTAEGSTNGVKGLEAAYLISEREFIPGGNNQVILATDGKFNAGSVNPAEIEKMIQKQAEKGTKLSVIGLGKKDISEATMQQMATAGGGSFLLCQGGQTNPVFLLDDIKKYSRKK